MNPNAPESAIGRAVGSMEDIVRSEVRLAKSELKDKAVEAGGAVAMLAAGAVAGLFGLGFLLVSVHKTLSRLTRPGFSAFAIGTALGGGAALLMSKGVDEARRLNLKPERTIESARQTVETVRRATE